MPLASEVSLTATPGTNLFFSGWIGGGCQGVNTCVVTISGDTTIIATFSREFFDDFSTDTGMWTYTGYNASAYRDEIKKYAVLTDAVNGIAGVMWLKNEITVESMTVEFSYKAGNPNNSDTADGFVMMFYKELELYTKSRWLSWICWRKW